MDVCLLAEASIAAAMDRFKGLFRQTHGDQWKDTIIRLLHGDAAAAYTKMTTANMQSLVNDRKILQAEYFKLYDKATKLSDEMLLLVQNIYDRHMPDVKVAKVINKAEIKRIQDMTMKTLALVQNKIIVLRTQAVQLGDKQYVQTIEHYKEGVAVIREIFELFTEK